MKSKLIYVELKSEAGDNGPAWIGKGFFSRSGRSIYFIGKLFSMGQGISSNYYDVETGEDYWISGVKKDGTDRHACGSGLIYIDKSVVPEYLTFRSISLLPKNKYEEVELNNDPPKQYYNALKNKPL